MIVVYCLKREIIIRSEINCFLLKYLGQQRNGNYFVKVIHNRGLVKQCQGHLHLSLVNAI